MDLHHRAQLRAPRMLWLLPWALVLVASTSLAYPMNVAVGSSLSARLPQVDVSRASTRADLPAARAFFYDEEVDAPCDRAPCRRIRRWLPTTTGSCETNDNRQENVDFNTWIPAARDVGLCRDDGT